MRRLGKSASANAPLAAFGLIYVLTCYFGAMALLFGPQISRDWYVSRTGARMPPLTSRDVLLDVALLNLAPLLLAAGWWIIGRLLSAPASPTRPAPSDSSRAALPILAVSVGLLACVLLVREGETGAFGLLSGWLHYGSLISGRAMLINGLSNWDFVVAYTLLPLVAGLLVSEIFIQRPRLAIALPVSIFALSSVAAVNLLLLQKRPFLIALLIVATVITVRAPRYAWLTPDRRRRAGWLAAGGAVVGYGIYVTLLVIPILSASVATGKTLYRSEFNVLGRAGWRTAGPLVRAGANLSVVSTPSGAALAPATTANDQGLEFPLGVVHPGWNVQFRVTLYTLIPGQSLELLLGSPPARYETFRFRTHSTPSVYTVSWTGTGQEADIAIRSRQATRLYIPAVVVQRTPSVLPPSVTPAPSITAAGGSRWISPPSRSGGSVRFPSYADTQLHPVTNSLTFLVLMAPTTRTSGPAIAYPALYPHRHPFYPLDTGLWVAGIGNAPNDNQTSFKLLFPTSAQAGTNSVPFMFVLYSQGGLIIALIGALIIGALWRFAWLIASPWATTILGAGAAALLVVFGVYIAQDGAINSLLTSYGIVWPAVALAAAGGVYAAARAIAGSIPAAAQRRSHS